MSSPGPSQHTPSPWVRNLERNLLAFDGMADLLDTRETEPLRERITPPEPRKSQLTSFKYSQLVANPASQTQERPRLLAQPDRLVYYKRYASNFFINVSSYIDFTIRPRLEELLPGIFPQYDYALLGLGAQDREITKEIKDPKSEMYLQMSVIKKISRGVRSAGREVRRSARKTGRAFKKAGKKTGKWIKEHPGETAAIVVGVALIAVGGVLIAAGAKATGGAIAGAGGASAGGGGAAAKDDNNRPRRTKEDEEEKSRPIAPPPASIPPPPPQPVQPISTAPIGMPPAITQPVITFPPGYINVPPEHQYSAPLIHMPAPVPPVPSYPQSVHPIAAAPHSTSPGMSPQAGRIEPPRTTSPVAPGLSGGHYVAPRPTAVAQPQETLKEPPKQSGVLGLGSSESEKARSEDFEKAMTEFVETVKGAGAKIAYPFVQAADAVNRTQQEAETGLRNVIAISQGKSKDEFLKEEKEYQDFVRKVQKESPGTSALLGVRNNDSLTDAFLEQTGGRGPGENIVERGVQSALATGTPAGAVPAVGHEIQDRLGIKLSPAAQSALDALELAVGIKSGKNILALEKMALADHQITPVEATGLKGRQAVVPENAAATEVQAPAAGPKVLRTEPVAPLAQESGALKKPDVYAPDRPLPRTEHGVDIPDTDAAHTQLGKEVSKRNPGEIYVKAREFNEDGTPVRDIDFTDHAEPDKHTNPHQHRHAPNPTGGSKIRSKPEPVPEWEYEEK